MSQVGKVEWQMAGMANWAQRADMSGEEVITEKVAASFCSTYSWSVDTKTKLSPTTCSSNSSDSRVRSI